MKTKLKTETKAAPIARVAIGGESTPLEVMAGVLKGVNVEGAWVTVGPRVNPVAESVSALPSNKY